MYPFHQDQGIAYYYVLESELNNEFVAPLRSLAWFDNNCFVNAAVHAAAGLGLWAYRRADHSREGDDSDAEERDEHEG